MLETRLIVSQLTYIGKMYPREIPNVRLSFVDWPQRARSFASPCVVKWSVVLGRAAHVPNKRLQWRWWWGGGGWNGDAKWRLHGNARVLAQQLSLFIHGHHAVQLFDAGRVEQTEVAGVEWSGGAGDVLDEDAGSESWQWCYEDGGNDERVGRVELWQSSTQTWNSRLTQTTAQRHRHRHTRPRRTQLEWRRNNDRRAKTKDCRAQPDESVNVGSWSALQWSSQHEQTRQTGKQLSGEEQQPRTNTDQNPLRENPT